MAGLTSAQAAALLAEHGPNELAAVERPRWLARFAANFVHLFALLLWAGAGLAAVGGMPELAVAIVIVIAVNALFSFAQEYRAEQAVEALGRVLPRRARVRRDGHLVEVDAEALVPGDVMLLAAGNRVSADARLLASTDLRVDMSTLTGESRPVSVTDRVFAGTHVFSGAAEALVTETGMRTELGRIARLTQTAARHPSPLEHQMTRMTRVVAALSVTVGALFFALAGSLGMGTTERFLFAIGVIVANVPEGLLPTVTLSLALATQRMARRNAIVRRLSAVETLGCTTVICTDKTGTLTANEMTVRRVWTPARAIEVGGTGYDPAGETVAGIEELARAGALCNDAALSRSAAGWRLVGDPTEGALLTLALKAGVDPEAEARLRPRTDVVPFDAARRDMTTVHGDVAYVKGAPDVVLARASLPAAERERALAAAAGLAREGLRVIAIARGTAEPPGAAERVAAVERAGTAEPPAAVEPAGAAEPGAGPSEVAGAEPRVAAPAAEPAVAGLTLLGLVGMHDPPRPEVAAAVRACRTAGIRVLMVTGDDGRTGEAIARRIGLLDGPAQVLDGAAIDARSDDALLAALREPGALVARVTPEQKLRIARTLHASGEIVAMTGDGVNDAPALRAADIGVAMGRSGTDVAREAADIVLADDDFASIAAAVEEGRAVYDNIRRFAQYHFSSNVAELLAFLAWGLSGGAIPLPLVVMQVLAIDLGTDLLPAIALGTERPEPGAMTRPPRPRAERLLNRRTLGRVYGFVGPLVGLAGMATFLFSYWLAGWRFGDPLPDAGHVYVQATAATYAGIVAGQVGAGLAFRTARESLLRVGPFTNRSLLWGIAFELALLVAVLYVPPLQDAFHTAAIEPLVWPLLGLWPLLVIGAEEARKAVLRRA